MHGYLAPRNGAPLPLDSHVHADRTVHLEVPCSQVEEKLTCMYNDQSTCMYNDLRALLFGHYARESKATSSPLAVDGFSRDSVKKKHPPLCNCLGLTTVSGALKKVRLYTLFIQLSS